MCNIVKYWPPHSTWNKIKNIFAPRNICINFIRLAFMWLIHGTIHHKEARLLSLIILFEDVNLIPKMSIATRLFQNSFIISWANVEPAVHIHCSNSLFLEMNYFHIYIAHLTCFFKWIPPYTWLIQPVYLKEIRALQTWLRWIPAKK